MCCLEGVTCAHVHVLCVCVLVCGSPLLSVSLSVLIVVLSLLVNSKNAKPFYQCLFVCNCVSAACVVWIACMW